MTAYKSLGTMSSSYTFLITKTDPISGVLVLETRVLHNFFLSNFPLHSCSNSFFSMYDYIVASIYIAINISELFSLCINDMLSYKSANEHQICSCITIVLFGLGLSRRVTSSNSFDSGANFSGPSYFRSFIQILAMGGLYLVPFALEKY